MSGITHVIKRSGVQVPFNPDRITNAIYRAAVAVGGRDKNKAEELTLQVIELLDESYGPDNPPHIEDIQDSVEKVLIENGHARVAKAYILYRQERNRTRHTQTRRASTARGNVPWAKIWHVLDWAIAHNLHTVQHLNERVLAGDFVNIIHESETAYEDDVREAAAMISEQVDTIRVVIVSGPSSSGKTTTTMKLEKLLKHDEMSFKALNVDHYFFDLEMHPKDEFGDYDFETPQALDIDLINHHLEALMNGDEVLIPFYDFKTGIRKLDQTPFKLESDEILLIDSLHGLFPDMTQAVPPELKFMVYIEPLLQMKGNDGKYVRWTDLRLIRRMLRDEAHRAYDPQKTLEHWHYVRSSEMRHIIPYQNTSDYIINSAMPYELCLYAHMLSDSFKRWEEKYRDDPLRGDAFARASRLYRLLSTIEPIGDDSSVPSESVLREFIGGSSLKY